MLYLARLLLLHLALCLIRCLLFAAIAISLLSPILLIHCFIFFSLLGILVLFIFRVLRVLRVVLGLRVFLLIILS